MSSEWRQNFERAIRHPKFKEYLNMETVILPVLLQQRELSGLSNEDFNQLILNLWNHPNTRIPQINENDDLYFIIPGSMIEYWKRLPPDIFKMLVLNYDISGKDLISLCLSHPEIDLKCNHGEQEIFRLLLERDYGVTNVPDPRNRYFKQLTYAVYGSGSNQYGQLGQPEFRAYQIPTKIPNAPPIDKISCGADFTAFLDEEGGVWMCGFGGFGQLGLGITTNIGRLTKIPTLPPIKEVSCGRSHTAFLDVDSRVWMCGHGSDGRLGLGNDHTNRLIPTLLDYENLPPIIHVNCGSNYTALLDDDGTVWMCGNNDNGKLGLSMYINIYEVPTPITTLPPIIQVSCGMEHVAFLDDEGDVWTCGHNTYGQLGLGRSRAIVYEPTKIPDLPQITQVSCGPTHTALLDDRGNVFMCGRNLYGQLGFNEKYNRNYPTHVPLIRPIIQVNAGDDNTTFLDHLGGVWVCGSNDYGKLGINSPYSNIMIPEIIPSLRKIKQVATGRLYTIFLQKWNPST